MAIKVEEGKSVISIVKEENSEDCDCLLKKYELLLNENEKLKGDIELLATDKTQMKTIVNVNCYQFILILFNSRKFNRKVCII